MKVIKHGTPKQQILHIACDCGCEYELYDNEIWEHCGQAEVNTVCPTSGYQRNVNRDYVKVVDGCAGNRCARLSCDSCEWMY